MRRLLSHADRFYPLIIALLLVAGAVWLEHITRTPEAVEASNNQTPDFIADHIRITGFNKDGSLRYTLDSPHLTHFPLTDTTHVEQPKLLLISQGRRMLAGANSGEVGPKGEELELIGKVEIEREGMPGDAPLHLYSEKLTIWPQEQRAVSNAPVRLTQGNDHAVGNNLTVDNIFGVTKLSGKVRMHFTPRNQRNP